MLYVSASQTLLLLMMAALMELFLVKKFPNREAVKRLRPVPVLVVGFPLGVIWFCVLGSELLVVDPSKLGTYHMIPFNESLGVLIVTTLGSWLGGKLAGLLEAYVFMEDLG